MQQANARLTEGPIPRTLATMAGGMLIGFFAAAAFNITDTYFVAQLGTRELAAMSFTFPVAMTIHSLAMGIGIGAAAVISRRIGQGSLSQVKRLTTDTLLLAVVCVAVLVTVGLITMRPLFTLLGAEPDVLPLVEQYMRIWYIGVGFVIVPMVGNNAIRATGDTLSPSLIMLVDLGLNIVLDPPLIFGFGPIPAMGIAGAALATVFCRALALVASLYVLGRRKRMLTLERPSWARLLDSWKHVLHIGIPSAATFMLQPLYIGILVRLVAWFGTPAVAAFGAGTRVQMLAGLPIMALGASTVPFVGQNRGAGRFDRIVKGHTASFLFSLGWGAVCVIVLLALARPIAGLFSSDPLVRRYLVLLLCIAPLAYGFRGLGHISMSGMNAIGKPYHAAAAMLTRLCVLCVPLAAVGAALFRYTGLLWGATAAEVIAGLLMAWWVRRLYAKSAREAAAHAEPSTYQNLTTSAAGLDP